MSPLKSKPLIPAKAEEVKRRIEGALARYDRGETLTEKELLIAQWIRHGGGCSSCAAVPVIVRYRNPKAGRAR